MARVFMMLISHLFDDGSFMQTMTAHESRRIDLAMDDPLSVDVSGHDCPVCSTKPLEDQQREWSLRFERF